MPGEDPELQHFTGARRWLTIYEQRQALLQVQPDVSQEVLDSIAAGVTYWRRRLSELSGLELDSDRRVIRVGSDGEVPLTQRELQLLEFMLQHSEKYFADHVLAVRAWGEQLSGDQVRIYIRRLRGKLEGTGWEVASKRGYGYALVRRPHLYRLHNGQGQRPSAELVARVVGRSRALMAQQQAQLDLAVAAAERLRQSLGIAQPGS